MAFRFFKGKQQAALAAQATGVNKAGGKRGLARAGQPRHQHTGAAVIAAAIKHLIQAFDAGRHDVFRRLVIESGCGDGHHRQALLIDKERVFISTVRRAAVLDDPQAARSDLIGHAVIQQNHAVRHVLFYTVTGQQAFAALACYYSGHAAFFEPIEQAAQLGAQHGGVLETAEQRLDGVEHNALGANGVDGVTQTDEQAFEIVLAGFFYFAAVYVHVVDDHQLLVDERLKVEIQRADVFHQVLRAFFKAHEHTGLAVLQRAVYQKAHGEQRLAATGNAAHQTRPALRQTTQSDFIETGNAGSGFFQCCNVRRGMGLLGQLRSPFKVMSELLSARHGIQRLNYSDYEAAKKVDIS